MKLSKRRLLVMGLAVPGILFAACTPAHVHEYEEHAAKSATCTTDGNKLYYTCSDCGKVFDADKVETTLEEVTITKLGHSWGTPDYTWDVEPDEDGKMHCEGTVTCTRDESHENTEIVEAVYSMTSAVTCTEPEKGVWTATFTKEGLTTQTKNVTVGTANGHMYSEVSAKEPTCTEDGNIKYYECENCTELFIDDGEGGKKSATMENIIVEALDHDWGTPSYEWSDDHSTCTATVKCTRDDTHKIEEEGDVTYEKTADATCETPEQGTWTATFENELFEEQEYSGDYGDPLGHDIQWVPGDTEDVKRCINEGCEEDPVETFSKALVNEDTRDIVLSDENISVDIEIEDDYDSVKSIELGEKDLGNDPDDLDVSELTEDDWGVDQYLTVTVTAKDGDEEDVDHTYSVPVNVYTDTISSAEEFKDIMPYSGNPNLVESSSTRGSDVKKAIKGYFKQTADFSISLTDGATWNDAFQATYDGDGHTIDVTRAAGGNPSSGLFLNLDDAEILNLNINDNSYTNHQSACLIAKAIYSTEFTNVNAKVTNLAKYQRQSYINKDNVDFGNWFRTPFGDDFNGEKQPSFGWLSFGLNMANKFTNCVFNAEGCRLNYVFGGGANFTQSTFENTKLFYGSSYGLYYKVLKDAQGTVLEESTLSDEGIEGLAVNDYSAYDIVGWTDDEIDILATKTTEHEGWGGKSPYMARPSEMKVDYDKDNEYAFNKAAFQYTHANNTSPASGCTGANYQFGYAELLLPAINYSKYKSVKFYIGLHDWHAYNTKEIDFMKDEADTNCYGHLATLNGPATEEYNFYVMNEVMFKEGKIYVNGVETQGSAGRANVFVPTNLDKEVSYLMFLKNGPRYISVSDILCEKK